MQPAPAPTPTTNGNDAARIIHYAHRCGDQPGKTTWCGLNVGTSPISPQQARKHIPCAVCSDLRGGPCERCGAERR